MKPQKTLEECLAPETVTLIDKIVAEGKKPPADAKGLEVEDLCEETEAAPPAGTPKAQGAFRTVCKFGWVKERHPWGIRVDFRPCSVGGMTDIFAVNIVSIEEIGWRGCNAGGSWHKSNVCYRA